MRRTALLIATLVTTVILGACGGAPSTQGEIAEIVAASSAFQRQVEAENGVIVSIAGSEVRATAGLDAFDVAPGTALHYLIVEGRIYVDASLNGDKAFIEGTEANLRKMGVEPEKAVEDAARLAVLMRIPKTASEWGPKAEKLVRISNTAHRLTVPVDAIKGARDAGLTGDVELFFVRDTAGKLAQWGVFEKAGQSVKVEELTEVRVTTPSKESLTSVPGR